MAEPIHNQWGQYVVDGKNYQRVTTLAGLMEDRFNLEKWGKRKLARGLVLRPDVLAMISACPDDDANSHAKKRLDGYVEQAIEAAMASKGANLGNALHELTARVDSGEDIQPMPPLDRDIEAYVNLCRDAGIKMLPEYIEKTCVVPELNVAGTFDRIVEVAGRLWIADLKTGRDLNYGWTAIAIQLAAYSRAEFIWDWERNISVPMPAVEQHKGLIIHLPAGTGTASLHVVDLEAGWEAAKQACWVREWRKRKDLSQPAKTRGKT